MHVIIENTDMFRLTSIGNGAAYLFTNKVTGEEKAVQYGDAATDFRNEYAAMCALSGDPNSAWYHVPWNTCLNDLFEAC